MNANKEIFNKLVRDKIPEIIIKNGDTPETQILDDETYLKRLNEKLLEECNEYISAENSAEKAEELADVLEVLYAIIDVQGLQKDEIEAIREQKKEKRGAFKDKILLVSTISNNDKQK